jgi:hypothetical protein
MEKRRAVRGPKWTAQDIDQLCNLIDQGHGYDAIARKMKRTREAVIIKAKRIRYRLRHTQSAWTCRQIARVLGVGCEPRAISGMCSGWICAPGWTNQHTG